jgi:hypothetical protein
MTLERQKIYVLKKWLQFSVDIIYFNRTELRYRSADKSLALAGRKQVRKHVRDARDINNIETRAVTNKFFPARQGAKGNSCHSDRTISFFSFLVELRSYQHPCISAGHIKLLQEIRIWQTDGGITQLTFVTVTLCPKRTTLGVKPRLLPEIGTISISLPPKPAMYLFYMSRDCTQFAQRSRISNYVEPSSHYST